MSRREKFSIRKSHRGAISTCIAVLGLFSLAGLGQEAKAEELVLTSADTSLVEADAFTTSEQEETSLELTTLSVPVEEDVAVTGTETIQEVEAELDQAQEDVAQAGQSLEEAEAAQAQAKSDLDQAQAALDAVETSRTETRQVGTKTETVQTGTKTETVQTGTRTEQVQVGTTTENKVQRVTEQVQVGTRTEQVQTGTKTEQVQTGSRFETQTVGEETQTITTGYRTEQVQVGEETVTEGGNSTLKAGTMVSRFSGDEGVLVTDAYITAIKNLANGTGIANDVRTAIKAGDGSGLGLHDFLSSASASNFQVFYDLHQYDLSNSDKTTKYDVLDLPYEVRKDLALFYTALINDVRAKVGTEPLKVTEESLAEAYNLVDEIRNANTKYNGGQRNSLGLTILEDNYLADTPRSELDAEGYFNNQIRGENAGKFVVGSVSEATKTVAQQTNSDLLGMNYLTMQAARDLLTKTSGAGNHARYQTLDNLKYGILGLVSQQLFGYEGNGNNNEGSGGLNGTRATNYQVALKVLGLDDSKVNTVGFDTSFYGSLEGYAAAENEVLFTFSRTNDTALANPYQDTTGGTTKVVPIYETRQVPITETRVVPITKQVEVPVYTTIETPIYETREVPIYEEKTSIKVVPVETPVYESRQVPVYETIETPIYEEVETPVYETVEVAVAVPQNLLDALSQAKANYDTAQAQTQQARESYKAAQDRLTEVQAKLADLQTPVVDEVPRPTETPVVEEVSSPTETPAVEEVPSPTETPAVEEIPSPTETPVVEEISSPTETPVTEDSPAPVEKPASPTEDKVEPSPAGGAAAAGQDKPVTSRLTGIGSSERPVITATASGSGYSRVARHQADKSLPNTGDTNAIISLLGLAVAGLGMVGLKRKRG